MATTKHTCNDGRGPAFGRKTAGCPRCDELLAGATPVRWNTAETREREAVEAQRQAMGQATDRAQAAVRAQLPTCCANHVTAYTASMGKYIAVSVDCPRHGRVTAVEVKPVPALLYPTSAASPVIAEQLR